MDSIIDHLRTHGEKVKDNETYEIYDLKINDKGLILSMTVLHENKETSGHSHEPEELYTFLKGKGELKIGDEKQPVQPYMTVPIPSNTFHKVYNKGSGDCIFFCLFQKYEGFETRGKN